MKKLLLICIALLVVWGLFFRETDAPLTEHGVRTASSPEQSPTENSPWMFGEAKVVPLAAYRLSARVLSRKRYFFDPTSDISPLDLALGWGDMSDSAVIETLAIGQGGRWYDFYFNEKCPVPLAKLLNQSANVHCLPSDSQVKDDLLRLRKNSFVTLEGFLVEVQWPNRPPWRSSLTREDSGNGACEIFWITKANEYYP